MVADMYKGSVFGLSKNKKATKHSIDMHKYRVYVKFYIKKASFSFNISSMIVMKQL